MIRSIWVATTVCFLVTGSMSSVQGSEPKDFEKYCELMEGRWVGEVTWIADWPGLGKRGDKSVAYLECARTEDGKALSFKFVGGTGSVSGFTVYDTVSKKINEVFVVSGGYVGQREITVSGNTLHLSGTGSLPDGRKHTTEIVRTLSENGKEFNDQSTGDIDGKATDEAVQRWRKVSRDVEASVADSDFKKFGDQLVGRWIRDIVYVHDWEGAAEGRGGKATGYHEFQWINDGRALREYSVDGESRSESIICVDPISNRIVQFGSSATGVAFLGVWEKTRDHRWTLKPVEGGTGKGEKFGGEVIYEFADDGKRIDTSGVITLDGKPLDELQDVLHRLSP